jgi:hypothetical protein
MKRAFAISTVLVALFAAEARAGDLSVRQVYRTAPALVGLPTVAFDPRYQNAADVVLEQAIGNVPLHPGAASAYTWRWNAERGELERVDDTVAPWFVTERGQTLGEGLLNVGVTFGYLRIDRWNGRQLGDDPVTLSAQGAPIDYRARTDLVCSVGTFNLTYGVLDDLDVNVAIPIVTLDLDLGRPRAPPAVLRAARGGARGGCGQPLRPARAREVPPLRRRVGRRGDRAPHPHPHGESRRGARDRLREIGPYAALSTSLLDGWLDSHWDAGVDAGIGNTRWSSAHYGWALDLHARRGEEWWRRLALACEAHGRREFTSVREPSSSRART